MHRFFCTASCIKDKEIVIQDNGLTHYIRDVLRLRAGDKISIFDERAVEYNCEAIDITKNIRLKILEKKPSREQANKINLTIACAIPKMTKMDDIVDKLTQLGVDRIIPMESERVIVKLDKNRKIVKHKRWEKIALSATQQSQRTSLPIIEPIQQISEVLDKAASFDLKLIPILIGERRTLKDIFTNLEAKNVLVFIGPEGDFTPVELELAKERGFTPATLGDLVLRVDTAAIAVASFIRLYANH